MFLLYLLYFSNFVFLFTIINFPHSSGNFTTLSTSLQLFIPLPATCSPHVICCTGLKSLQSQAHHCKNTQDHIHICSHHSIQDQPVICSCPHYLLFLMGKQQNRKQWKHVSSLDSLDHVGAFGRPCKKHGKHQCCEDHQTDKPDPEPFFYFHKDLFSRLFKDQDHQACCK